MIPPPFTRASPNRTPDKGELLGGIVVLSPPGAVDDILDQDHASKHELNEIQ